MDLPWGGLAHIGSARANLSSAILVGSVDMLLNLVRHTFCQWPPLSLPRRNPCCGLLDCAVPDAIRKTTRGHPTKCLFYNVLVSEWGEACESGRHTTSTCSDPFLFLLWTYGGVLALASAALGLEQILRPVALLHRNRRAMSPQFRENQGASHSNFTPQHSSLDRS